MGQTIAVDLILALNHEISPEFILVNTELGLSWIDPIVYLYDMISYQKIREKRTNSR